MDLLNLEKGSPKYALIALQVFAEVVAWNSD